VTIFLDTNVVIYLVENTPGFGIRAAQHVSHLRAGGHTFAVSDLVRMECRVHPMRQGNLQVLADFDSFFASSDVQVLSLTSPVCERATALRATHNFKTIDALHLAAAIVHACDRFLSGDARLSHCPDIPVDLLP
jgi:predicted nucleic acid-binding protein